METTSPSTEDKLAEYDLVMSFNIIDDFTPKVRTYYARLNEENYAEFLIKDFVLQENIPLKTASIVEATIVSLGEKIRFHCTFSKEVSELLAGYLRAEVVGKTVMEGIETFGIASNFHNMIIGNAGLEISSNWRETEFVISKKYYIGKIAKILVRLEAPYYFSAEYLNLFTHAKFDYYAEDSDIYKGEDSNTIWSVFAACHRYFQKLESGNAKDFFAGNPPSENPFEPNADKDLVGKLAKESFERMYRDCTDEKACWAAVAKRRGFLKNI